MSKVKEHPTETGKRSETKGSGEQQAIKQAKTQGEVEIQRARPMSRFEEMERWFDEFLPGAWMRRRGWPSWGELVRPIEGVMPRVDVIDRDDEVVVRAELPGVEKDNLEVSLDEETLTIKGKTAHETREEKGEYFRAEIARGEFSRTLTLPTSVDPDSCQAEFKDGVLELMLKKMEGSKRRRIPIQ